jgi:ParB family chromosome partitioning protein
MAATDTAELLELGYHPDLPLDRLRPHPHNPRKSLGDLSELVDDVAVHGVIQALTVLPDGTIVAGHRRHAAAAKAGLTTIPVIVSDLDELTQRAVMFSENYHRAGLSPLEEAKAFEGMASLGKSQREIADLVGVNQSHVSKRVALTKLPEVAQLAVEDGAIRIEDAVALTKLPPAAVTDLFTRHMGPPPRWALDREVEALERAARFRKTVTALRKAAVREVERPADGYDDDLKVGPVPVFWLEWIGAEQHEGEPCHAVIIDERTITPVCMEPTRHPEPEPEDQDGDPDDRTTVPTGEQTRLPLRETPAEKTGRELNERLRAAQERRGAFVAELLAASDAGDLGYSVAVLLDGVEIYDTVEDAGFLAFAGVGEIPAADGEDDGYDVRRLGAWRAVVGRIGAEPSLAGRLLYKVALDTAESVLSVSSHDRRARLDYEATGVAQLHLEHLAAHGYEVYDEERDLAGFNETPLETPPVDPERDPSTRAGCLDMVLRSTADEFLIRQARAAKSKSEAAGFLGHELHTRGLSGPGYELKGSGTGIECVHLGVKLSWNELAAWARDDRYAHLDGAPDVPADEEGSWDVSCADCGLLLGGADSELEALQVGDEHRQEHPSEDVLPDITVAHDGITSYLRTSHDGGPYLAPHSQAELDAEATGEWEGDPPPTPAHKVEVGLVSSTTKRKRFCAVCHTCGWEQTNLLGRDVAQTLADEHVANPAPTAPDQLEVTA